MKPMCRGMGALVSIGSGEEAKMKRVEALFRFVFCLLGLLLCGNVDALRDFSR